MNVVRSGLALVFWGLAIAAAIPAFCEIYPLMNEAVRNAAASPSLSAASRFSLFPEEASGAWRLLVVSSACIANATLLQILSAIKRL